MANNSAASYNKTLIQIQKLTNQANKESFAFNKQEASTARAWQTQMSNTSHQREVADLKKAGLNPVLSANQGAASYTTSSASDHADNSASAVANVYGAKTSADATRAAAAQSAAATREAAKVSAAAQRYAAAMAYQASIYHSDRAKEAQKYNADKAYAAKKYGIDNQLASNPIQAIDKITRNSGIQNAVQSGKIIKDAVKSVRMIANGDISKLGSNIQSIVKNGYPALSRDAKNGVMKIVGKLGLNNTTYYRNVVTRALICKDPLYIAKLLKLVDINKKNSSRSANYSGRLYNY